jgi:hypothetical protein
MEAVGRGEGIAEPARRALISLTKQDFGTAARKWRAWWSKHRREHRIEWLLEGLASKDADIRRSAVEDLRMLTGEFFDYQYDAARRDREQARQRWIEWWQQVGRARFQAGGSGTLATAILPGKR